MEQEKYALLNVEYLALIGRGRGLGDRDGVASRCCRRISMGAAQFSLIRSISQNKFIWGLEKRPPLQTSVTAGCFYG